MKPELEYKKMKKKYKKLPDWKWIDENFEMKEECGRFSLILREAVRDRLSAVVSNMIEPLISGSENYCCWFERKFITGEEKEELFEVYKALQALLWEESASSIEDGDKELADFLIDLKKAWDAHMPRVAELCRKVSAGWKGYKKNEVETAYHG